MEQEPSKNPVEFKVLWHGSIKDDLKSLGPEIVQFLIEGAKNKLSKAPQFLGEPLKGTTKKLWKVAYSKYRILYTIMEQEREVWVLSIQNRDIVYKRHHVENLLRIATAIHQARREHAEAARRN